MANTVVGLFDDYNQAQDAVQELVNRGFDRSEISLAANRHAVELAGHAPDESAGVQANPAGASNRETTGDHGMTAGDAAGAGATAGAVIGGIGGLLLGLGLLAIPGLGPLVAAGPIMAMVTGAGVGAAAGGLVGALTSVGVPQHQAGVYAEGVRRGGTLVIVNAPEGRDREAADLLTVFGAVDTEERAQQYRDAGYTGFDGNATPYTRDQVISERQRWGAAGSGRRAVLAGSSADPRDANSANLGGTNDDNVDQATRNNLVDAEAHADSDVGDLAAYMDPGTSHLGAFDDSLSDSTRSTL